jgi:hypothetical protein
MNISTKEYVDLLGFMKEIIYSEDFNEHCFDEGIYSKEYIRKILSENSKTKTIIDNMRDKNRLSKLNDKNVFNLLKNFKTHEKENKLVINSLELFSVFYNEPKHFEKLNFSIYNKIIENILIMSRDIRLVSLING